MRTGLDAHADVIEAGLQLIGRFAWRWSTACRSAGPPTVPSNTRTSSMVRIDRVRRIDLGDIARAAEIEVADVENVFPIRGKVMRHQHAAARAQRQALLVFQLQLAGSAR